ncbi:erythromycin esterase family protein [Ideonella sp. BN130291]|uniref:erythromycin esterase family protein n=1 Tax=Ideonella sp. BN130291 TaxID=3112940 RepID=UPI002E26F440|nr:erythromycin esterase family protein [Ideonella sp. BN130291]
MSSDADLLSRLLEHAVGLAGLDDLDPVLRRIGDARTVLLGEASHGSLEFYRLRAQLTRRLITEHGFDAVAVEADWPDTLRASRWAMGHDADASAERALGGFERFPQWMWRNPEVLGFLQWLRQHNAQAQPPQRVGFFGLDLYSLRASMQAVLHYLDQADPTAAARARQRYSCFDHFGEDPQFYGQAVRFGLTEGCEREVLQQLQELCSSSHTGLLDDAAALDDEHFHAQQNAQVVRNAEAYYRAMFEGRVSSWNLRDDHMAGTLAALQRHLAQQRGRPAKVVVWAHNSHIGDARATAMADEGEINLGQRVREAAEAPGDTFLLGFTTHAGTVTAASDWDGAAERKTVLPSRAGSHERLLHDLGLPLALLPLRDPELQRALSAPRLERAIGVIYRPDTELMSHYFRARLAQQFDAVIHIDETQALPPLDASARWPQPHTGETETYPSGV